MLDCRRAAMEAEPCNVFASPGTVAEYTRVVAEGHFDHSRSMFIGPRARTVMGGTVAGHILVTPLHSRRWGKAVLVNRGWVPVEWQSDAAMRSAGQPSGQVVIEGIVRGSETPGSFVPANTPPQWYWLDASALAAAAQLPPETPLVEVIADATARSRAVVPSTMDVLGGRTLAPSPDRTYPSPKSKEELLQFSIMPDGHRNYALTWFTMAAAMLGLAVHAMRASRAASTGPKLGRMQNSST